MLYPSKIYKLTITVSELSRGMGYKVQPVEDPPVPYVFPDAGAAQAIPASGRPNGPVSTNSCFPKQMPDGNLHHRRIKNMTTSAMLLSLSHRSFQRQLFPIHLHIESPPPNNQRWEISADWPFATCTTLAPMLTWSAWSRAPLGFARW